MKDAAQVRIYYYRISGGCTLYTDGLIDDDGRRLKTFMVISEEERVKSSQKWWNWGLIPDSKLVYSVTKSFFYNEFFDILALHDKRGNLLGYYCDVVTPLEKGRGHGLVEAQFAHFRQGAARPIGKRDEAWRNATVDEPACRLRSWPDRLEHDRAAAPRRTIDGRQQHGVGGRR